MTVANLVSGARERPNERGVTFASDRHWVSFNFPVGYYHNRFTNPYTKSPGDSTFPEYVNIATYSMRFGGSKSHNLKVPAATDQPPATRVPLQRED